MVLGVGLAAFIPLEVAMDPHNQQKYQLKLDEELTKTLQEATAKKVIMQPHVIVKIPAQIHCPTQRSFEIYQTSEIG